MSGLGRGHDARAGLDVVVVLVLLGIAAVLVLVATLDPGRDGDPERPGSGDAPSDAPSAPSDGAPDDTPDDAPDVGQLVQQEITRGGELEVTHWVLGGAPVDTLTVAADQADGRAGTLPARDVKINAASETLASLQRVGAEKQRVALGRSVRQVRITYRIDALLDDSGTVPGRALARATALTIDYREETGPVRHTLTAPGWILSVACLRSDVASPRPCGASTGAGWRVDLEGADRDDGLLVQLQLD